MKKSVVGFIVAIMLLMNITAYADEIFTDVTEDEMFYNGISYAYEKGIINGVGDNQFNPQEFLTVAEAIKLSACIHADFSNYEDLKINEASVHWAEAYYDYAVANGIIEEGDFLVSDFDKAITRDRLFYIFANTLPDKEYPEINYIEYAPEQPTSEYVKKLFCAGIVIGNENGFEEEKTITRLDSATVVFRMTAHTRRRLVFEPMNPVE